MNLGEIETAIRALVGELDDTEYVTSATIYGWVNEAIRRVAMLTGCVKKSTTLTSTAGTHTCTLLDGWIGIDRVLYNDETPVKPALITWVDSRGYSDDDNANGIPEVFVHRQGELTFDLYPAPDTTGKNILVWGWGAPTKLTAAADIPEIPSIFHDMLPTWGVRCFRIVEGEDASARLLKDEFDSDVRQAWINLMHADNAGPGRLTMPLEGWKEP